MMKKKPKILILYTGGTFGMDIHLEPIQRELSLRVPSLSSDELKNRFQNQVPEIQQLAQCDVDILFNLDSAHIGPKEWIQIAQKIQLKWKSYDGIVLLHGTDTLAYTASALSFLLRPCLKPIVLTGAQRPLSALRTDARTNLISAVEIAALGPRNLMNQVTVVFGDQLFQGNRVRKKSATDFTAFESPHFPPLATIGTTVRYTEQPRLTSNSRLRLIPSFSQKVMLIHLTPAFPSILLKKLILSDPTSLEALVLVAFHSGTAPTDDPNFIHFLKLSKKLQIPVVIVTEGSTHRPSSQQTKITYAAGKPLFAEGCLWAGSMTPECAFVKTSLLLHQSQDPKRFSRLWAYNLACEGTPW